MPWFTRISRFGDAHIVYSQGSVNSCGIASVMMCVFKVNKFAPGRAAITNEQAVDQVYSGVSNTNYDGSAYTYANFLGDTLNKLNCGRWKAEAITPTAVPKLLMDTCGVTSGWGPTIDVSPVIVLVSWSGSGAHFVVVDTVRSFLGSTYATVCDPADGEMRVVEIKAGQSFAYRNSSVISLNIEGTPAHGYTGPNSGSGNGWVIHQI